MMGKENRLECIFLWKKGACYKTGNVPGLIQIEKSTFSEFSMILSGSPLHQAPISMPDMLKFRTIHFYFCKYTG